MKILKTTSYAIAMASIVALSASSHAANHVPQLPIKTGGTIGNDVSNMRAFNFTRSFTRPSDKLFGSTTTSTF